MPPPPSAASLVDTDGDGKPDEKLVWELDRDGTPETDIAERELCHATLGYQ